MFFSVQELEVHKISFSEDFAPGEINFEESSFRQIGPLHTEGHAELLNNTVGEIVVRGSLSVDMEVSCDRCLESVHYPVADNFTLFYRPDPKGMVGSEIAIDEGEAQIGFYEGAGLKLEDVVREQVFLSIPMQFICREECAGICPQCGSNRNSGDCGCHMQPVNDRWSALKDFKPGAKTGS